MKTLGAMRVLFLALSAVLLCGGAQKIRAADARAARTDVVVYTDANVRCGGSGATYVRNNNDSARVYATLQLPLLQMGSAGGPLMDRFFADLPDALPKIVGELFLPGESKFLGCGNNQTTPGWAILGGYYPTPDMSPSPVPNAADALIIITGSENSPYCLMPPQNQHQMFAFNTSHKLSLTFNVKNSTPGAKAHRITLQPFGQYPIGCRNEADNITFDSFEFAR